MAKQLGFLAAALVILVAALWFLGGIALPGLGRFERGRGEESAEPTLGAEEADGEARRLAGRGVKAGDGAEADTAAAPTPEVPAEVRGSAEKGGSIRGRVVREPGEIPVEGAHVRLRRPDSILHYLRASPKGRYDLLEARTGKDGRYYFRDVLPANDYAIRANLPPGPFASADGIDLRGRLTREIPDLVLGPAGRIEGRVLDGASKPVGDVRVAVSWPVENPLQIVLADPDTLEEVEREVRTKPDGTFAIDGLEPGEKTIVLASARDGADVRFDVGVLPGETTQLGDVVLAGGLALAGRIENEDGTAVPQARVFAAQMGQRVVRTAESDADGRFRIEHLPAGKYRLGVLIAGLPAKISDEHVAGSEDVVIRFPSTGTIEGRVVESGSGKPVRRFAVRVNARAEDVVEQYVRVLMEKTLGGQPFESAEGRFRFDRAFPGKARLEVTAQGYPDTTTEPFEVTAGRTADVRVELVAGNGGRGTVRVAEGGPAVGARVLVTERLDTKVVASDEDEDEDEDEDSSRFDIELTDADAVTDEEGHFTLGPQTPGRYRVVANLEGHLPGSVEVDFTNPAPSIEIRLPASGTIEGTVLDDAGRPAPNTEVIVIRPDGGSERAQTDGKGAFRLAAQPVGPAVVRWRSLRLGRPFSGLEEEKDAAPARYEALRRDGGEVQVRAGEVARVDLRMPRLTRWTGRLLGANPNDGNLRGLYLMMKEGWEGRWIRAGSDGRFGADVEPGRYLVWTRTPGADWKTVELDVPAGRDFEADVGP